MVSTRSLALAARPPGKLKHRQAPGGGRPRPRAVPLLAAALFKPELPKPRGRVSTSLAGARCSTTGKRARWRSLVSTRILTRFADARCSTTEGAQRPPTPPRERACPPPSPTPVVASTRLSLEHRKDARCPTTGGLRAPGADHLTVDHDPAGFWQPHPAGALRRRGERGDVLLQRETRAGEAGEAVDLDRHRVVRPVRPDLLDRGVEVGRNLLRPGGAEEAQVAAHLVEPWLRLGARSPEVQRPETRDPLQHRGRRAGLELQPGERLGRVEHPLGGVDLARGAVATALTVQAQRVDLVVRRQPAVDQRPACRDRPVSCTPTSSMATSSSPDAAPGSRSSSWARQRWAITCSRLTCGAMPPR